MNQISSFLSLRFMQFGRIVKEIGVGIILIALFLVTGSILGLIEAAIKVDPVYSILTTIILILVIDNFRKDKTFVIQVFGSKIKAGYYFCIEYGLLILPLVIYKLIVGQYLISLGIIFCMFTLTMISPYFSKNQNKGYKKTLDFISLDYFELKFFVEKRKISFYAIIVLLFGGAVHISLWILGLFLLMALIIEMFVYQEPLEMVRWRKDFVLLKSFSYILLTLPVLLLTATLTYLRLDLSIWVFVYGIITIIVAIFLNISNKYANYNGFMEKQPSSTSITIMVFLMILPGFILVSIVYSILKYKKAERQMKQLCSK